MSNDPAPVAPPRRRTGDARRWDAARDEYLAGSPAEAVCRRHDLRLATFRRRAREKGWRRMDQPESDTPPQQDEPLVIPEAPTGAIRGEDVALPLHCFSAPESHAPPPVDDDPPGGPAAAGPSAARDLLRFATRLAAVAQQIEQAAHDEAVRLPLHSLSPEESHAPPAPLDQAMRDLPTEILALRNDGPKSAARPEGP